MTLKCYICIESEDDARESKYVASINTKTTLENDQLDAKFFYFIIRLLQSSACFEQRRAHHQEVKLY